MSHRTLASKAAARATRAAQRQAFWKGRPLQESLPRWGVRISNAGRRYYRVSWPKGFLPAFWGSKFPNMRPGRSLPVLPKT